MIRTRVGYAGGTTKDPTYHSLRGHTETIQVDYAPDEISYQTLLDIFWKSHNPDRRSWSQQYKAAVFYHNEAQKKLATESKNRVASDIKRKLYTEIIPYSEFYMAEAYHQKHSLQQHNDLMREFRAMFPGINDFVDSTSAARVNGYLSGHGTPEQLQAELNSLGLSPVMNNKLLNAVNQHSRRN